MGAVPLVLGAIGSAASTASSFSGGTSYNTNSMTQVSLDQVAYLEERQKQKEALTLQMMDTAKNFANANFDTELSQLDLLRQQQVVQLEQQRALADYNYASTQATLDNQAYLYNVQNKYQDYQKAQAYQQAMYGLQTGMDARTIQLLAEEQARTQGLNYGNQQRNLEYGTSNQTRDATLSSADAQRRLNSDSNLAAYNKQLGDTQRNIDAGGYRYELGESNRQLEKLSATGQALIGNEQDRLQAQRAQGELNSQETAYNISEQNTLQSRDAQAAQLNLALKGQLDTLSDASKKALSEASKRMVTRGNSSSDAINNYNDQQINELLVSKERATFDNAVSAGLINSATNIGLAGIRASRADLAVKRLQIENDTNLSAAQRSAALSQLSATQKLAQLSEQFQYLTLPFVTGQADNEFSKLTNVDFVNQENQLSSDRDRAAYNIGSAYDTGRYNLGNRQTTDAYNLANTTGRSIYDLQNNSDLYNMNVATGAYNADIGYSDIMRQQEYDALNYAAQQAYAQNQQAKSDVNYGKQLTDKNYELGKYAAEQNKISTTSATDLKQAAYLAQQRAALSQALSGVQTGMLSSGTGGGTDWGAGISNLFGGLSGIISKTQNYQAQNNYLNRMGNIGQQQQSSGSTAAPASYSTWNSGTSNRW